MFSPPPTILIVDNENSIQLLLQDVLSREGYTTLIATSGIEALELSRRRAGPLDLVVSDILMPAMNGLELAEHLAVERPETAILFISGYTGGLNIPKDKELLEKPFRMADFLLRVQDMLLGRRGPLCSEGL